MWTRGALSVRVQTFLVIPLLILVWAVLVLPGEAKAATTPYVCHPAGCKYGKALLGYGPSATGQPLARKVDVIYARGGTATGWCDTSSPKNNITQWAVDASEGKSDAMSAWVYERQGGRQVWFRNRTSYKSNCSPDTRNTYESDPLWVFQVHVDPVVRPSADIVYWHKSSIHAHSFPGRISVHISV